jgi:hypothetical protein
MVAAGVKCTRRCLRGAQLGWHSLQASGRRIRILQVGLFLNTQPWGAPALPRGCVRPRAEPADAGANSPPETRSSTLRVETLPFQDARMDASRSTCL